jgi:hypothetical protein
MRIFVAAENSDGSALEDAIVQISCYDPSQLHTAVTGASGNLEFMLSSGHLDTLRCLVYCNGVRQGEFSLEDGDRLTLW